MRREEVRLKLRGMRRQNESWIGGVVGCSGKRIGERTTIVQSSSGGSSTMVKSSG